MINLESLNEVQGLTVGQRVVAPCARSTCIDLAGMIVVDPSPRTRDSAQIEEPMIIESILNSAELAQVSIKVTSDEDRQAGLHSNVMHDMFKYRVSDIGSPSIMRAISHSIDLVHVHNVAMTSIYGVEVNPSLLREGRKCRVHDFGSYRPFGPGDDSDSPNLVIRLLDKWG